MFFYYLFTDECEDITEDIMYTRLETNDTERKSKAFETGIGQVWDTVNGGGGVGGGGDWWV